jgi:hypothetical protein
MLPGRRQRGPQNEHRVVPVTPIIAWEALELRRYPSTCIVISAKGASFLSPAQTYSGAPLGRNNGYPHETYSR